METGHEVNATHIRLTLTREQARAIRAAGMAFPADSFTMSAVEALTLALLQKHDYERIGDHYSTCICGQLPLARCHNDIP